MTMTFGEKLSRLRKESNYTQEQLADILSVSRQSISKWESDMAYPETEKLIRMSKLFDCSLDYLLNDECEEDKKSSNNNEGNININFSNGKKGAKEFKSKKTWRGIPLWHIAKNARGVIAVGLNARGIIAIGLKAEGVISFGLLAIGLFAFGFVGLGLVAAGTFALGIVSAGALCVGAVTFGGICFGIVSVGGIALGDYSLGGLAIGKYAAIGGDARAPIAVGTQKVSGTVYSHLGDLTTINHDKLKSMIDTTAPQYLEFFKNIFKSFI